MSAARTPDGQAIYNTNGMQANSPYAQYFGHDDADWIYGWQNTFAYKNLSLSFSVDGRLGGLIYSTTSKNVVRRISPQYRQPNTVMMPMPVRIPILDQAWWLNRGTVHIR